MKITCVHSPSLNGDYFVEAADDVILLRSERGLRDNPTAETAQRAPPQLRTSSVEKKGRRGVWLAPPRHCVLWCRCEEPLCGAPWSGKKPDS
jgi:hypothetical protein